MDKIILGYYNKPPREGSRLGFVKVIGEIEDGEIIVNNNYIDKYPSEGEVAFSYPPDSLGINSVGLFRVEANENVNRTLHVYSEYRVASKDWMPPIEIIHANNIIQPKDVRELLISGLSLPFRPSKYACLLLDDETLIRIPELTALDDDSRIYKVKASLLKNPLECWKWLSVFNNITLDLGAYKRIFSSSINWPKNGGLFDCASNSEIVAFTFSKLSEVFKEDMGITKAQRREIVNYLESYEDELVCNRIMKTIEVLQKTDNKESLFEGSFKDILNTYPVIKEKEKCIKESVETALKAMESQKQHLIKEVEKLKNDKNRLEATINSLEEKNKELQNENENSIKIGEDIVNKIHYQVNQASDNAAELLANISLIKPFVNNELDNKKHVNVDYKYIKPFNIESNYPKSQYNNYDQLINLTAENIKSLGMSTSSAKKVARFIISIKLAKLTPLSVQADSRDFALAISASFTGKTPLIIPHSLLSVNESDLEGFILENSSDESMVILVEDVNSYSNESKLLSLLRDVKYIEKLGMTGLKAGENDRLLNNTIMLSSESSFTLLPVMPALWEHAIAINYGAFTNKLLQNQVLDFKKGTVPFNSWYEWPLNFITSNGLDELFEGLSKKGVTLSYAIKRNMHSLYTCLINIGADEKEALELIIINHLLVVAKSFNWINQLIEILKEEDIFEDISAIDNGIVWLGEKS